LDAWWASRRIELEGSTESQEASPAEPTRRLIVVAAVVFLAVLAAVTSWRKHESALPTEAAEANSDAAIVKLTPQQRARLIGSRTISPEVTRLLYRAVKAASRQNYQGFTDAITYFDQAIAKQPDLAQAYSAKSLCYIQFVYVGPLTPGEFMPKAEAAARKALVLDPEFAEAHAALGIVLYRYDWNWSAAEAEFRQALDLNPNDTDSHRRFAEFLIAAGRPNEALAEAHRARELDSISIQTLLESAATYRAAGQNDQAVGVLHEASENAPLQAHFQLGITYVQTGELNEALSALETAVRLAPGNLRFLAYLGYAYGASGKRAQAQRVLESLNQLSGQQYVSPVGIAAVHLALGEKEQALAWLERAYQIRDGDLAGIASDPRLRALHSDSHFRDLLQRIGLVH